MLNFLWIAMMLGAVAAGAHSGRLEAVSAASVESAQAAVTIALGIWGITALWLGLMRVLRVAGAMGALAWLLRPVMTRLFRDVPADHPAMGAMIMNMACNILGLGNVATPFGLKAMQELETLNRRPGVATDAMALFLAINTSGLAVLPTGMVALRASLGSKQPGAIFLPTLLATASAALCGLMVAKLFARLAPLPVLPKGTVLDERKNEKATAPVAPSAASAKAPSPPTSRERATSYLLVALVVAALGFSFIRQSLTEPNGVVGTLRIWSGQYFLALLMTTIVCIGLLRGVKIYDEVVAGAREAFELIQRIVPYLAVILVAVGMLRASGAMDLLCQLMSPFTNLIGMPADALPMALIRPLSGQGAYGMAAEIMKAKGPDSLTGQIVSTLMGSTETTFYVLAVYLGAAGIRVARHTVWACLAADLGGMLVSVWACRYLLGAS